jgi:hypothetical protein
VPLALVLVVIIAVCITVSVVTMGCSIGCILGISLGIGVPLLCLCAACVLLVLRSTLPTRRKVTPLELQTRGESPPVRRVKEAPYSAPPATSSTSPEPAVASPTIATKPTKGGHPSRKGSGGYQIPKIAARFRMESDSPSPVRAAPPPSAEPEAATPSKLPPVRPPPSLPLGVTLATSTSAGALVAKPSLRPIVAAPLPPLPLAAMRVAQTESACHGKGK